MDKLALNVWADRVELLDTAGNLVVIKDGNLPELIRQLQHVLDQRGSVSNNT